MHNHLSISLVLSLSSSAHLAHHATLQPASLEPNSSPKQYSMAHSLNCGILWRCCCVLVALLLLWSESVCAVDICLNMIAKNEAKDILECLEPLAPELAGWNLCDTGETSGPLTAPQSLEPPLSGELP